MEPVRCCDVPALKLLLGKLGPHSALPFYGTGKLHGYNGENVGLIILFSPNVSLVFNNVTGRPLGFPAPHPELLLFRIEVLPKPYKLFH